MLQESQEDAERIMKEQPHGVLAVEGDDGYSYAVPLSYAYKDGKIYFHGATEGHKYDAAKKSSKVSFCVIGQDTVVPEKFTSCYRSAVVFGQARLLSEGSEYDEAIYALAKKYSPAETEESIQKEIASSAGRLFMIAIDIDHMTGKEGIELKRMRLNGKE